MGGYLELEPLAAFRELEVLDLYGMRCGDGELAYFKHMSQLRTLRLARASIGDKGLRRLRFLKDILRSWICTQRDRWAGAYGSAGNETIAETGSP